MKITRTVHGVTITLSSRVWVTWSRRTDDEASDYDDYGPVYYSYRVVRLVSPRVTVTWEWRR